MSRRLSLWFGVGVFSALANYVLSFCSEPGNDRQQELLCKAADALVRVVHRNTTVCL